MKQKKTPVAVISVLSIMVMLFVIGNLTGFFQDPAAFFRPKPKAPAAPAPTADVNKDAAINQLKAGRNNKPQAASDDAEGGNRGELINGVPKEPTVVIPVAAKYTPVANDSNISGQWYRDESRQKARADKLANERAAAAGR